MSIVITGATGQLGRLVVEQLMAAGTPPDTIVATGRDTNKLTALSDDGVTVRRADFADPTSLTDAFAGAETLLPVSTATVGQRFDNHRHAIDAARDAEVSQIVYTSILNASRRKRKKKADLHAREVAELAQVKQRRDGAGLLGAVAVFGQIRSASRLRRDIHEPRGKVSGCDSARG